MTLQQLKETYIEYSSSQNVADRHRAAGYSDIIAEYTKMSSRKEYYEEVEISLVAERVLEINSWLYKSNKNPIYSWKIKAARDCIIRYISDAELSQLIGFKYKGQITEEAIFKFIDGTPYKGKVKYSSIHSICNVMNLSVGE